jgi:Tol biopolymer transport system component
MVDYTSNKWLYKNNVMPCLSIFIYILFVLLMGCSDTTEPEPIIGRVYPEIDEFPSWSPDGTRIIYYHKGITEIDYDGSYKTNPDSAGLWIINADGTDPYILLKSQLPMDGEWSPDGEWIVVSMYAQIYKARIDGGRLDSASVVQLTAEDYNFLPSVSPDGEWVAYESTDFERPYAIWKVKIDGTEKVTIHRGTMPDWSPAEDRIIFTMYSTTTGMAEIFAMNSDGSDLQQITSECDCGYYPEYSPGGNKIAFGSERSIWIVDADGDNLHTISDEAIPKGLSWSPDGERIAFVRGFKGSSNINNFGTIWIINKDGNNLQQLTQGVK